MGNAATSKKGDPAENGKKNNYILDHIWDNLISNTIKKKTLIIVALYRFYSINMQYKQQSTLWYALSLKSIMQHLFPPVQFNAPKIKFINSIFTRLKNCYDANRHNNNNVNFRMSKNYSPHPLNILIVLLLSNLDNFTI